jgi:hypothetical protein
MLSAFLVVKLLHVLLAIVAVGFTTTFGIIMACAPAERPIAIGAIARLEKVSGPAFGGLLITGLLMAWLGNLDWKVLWFASSLALMAVAMVLALGVARPTLAKQVALSKQSPPPVDELMRLGARSKTVGMILSLISLTLISLMIFKPVL